MHQNDCLRMQALAEAVSAVHEPRSIASSLRACVVAATGAGMLGSSLVSAPAAAQDDAGEPDDTAQVEEVVVTGSRIRRQDFTANSPITTIDRETFQETSTIGIETILNQLPQFVPAVTQFETTDIQNSAINTVGASTVSLRGLGSNRNLVLVNGRRAQPVNASLVVDTNSIPSAAIERVEVISGGASAVYGADAVGGVVNFILRDNYEGANLEVRYGATEDGDNDELTISGLIGANVADGRGNVMFGFEHSDRAKMHYTDTDWRVDEMNNPNILGGASDFWLSETYIQTTPSVGPQPFDQAVVDSLFPALPPGTITTAGPFYVNPTPDGTGTVFTGVGWFGATNAAGAYKYDGPFHDPNNPNITWRKVHPNGQITENSLDRWTSIPLDRYSAFAKAEYEMSDNVSVFMQSMFTRNRNETLLGFAGAALGANAAEIPYGDDDLWADSLVDPTLAGTPAAATAPTKLAYQPGGGYGLSCPPVGGCSESDVFPLPPEMRALLNSRPDPNADITVNRSLDFLGYRRSNTQTTNFQLLTGIQGELDNGWYWDAYVSHGQTETVINYSGFASLQRWREVAASPNFGVGFSRMGNEFGAGRGAGTATCTTGLPLIREFEISQDCIDAIAANNQNSSQLEQNMFEATLAGDAWDLPAGPLSFALGAAWRENTYRFQTDNLTTNESFLEQTLGNFPTSNTYGEFDVSEIYGEVLLPLVQGKPGVQQLNLELGGRYSDYSSVGEVDTFKALIDWTITPWARLRGGYQLATRAPNLGELFLSSTQSFAGHNSVWNDQCSENEDSEGPYSANPAFNINGAEGAAFTKAICSALMGGGALEYYSQDPEDQSTGLGLPNVVGNPNVGPEDADTWTFGIVIDSPFENPWLAALSATIDWYEIEITDMIANEGADPIYARCLSPDLNPTGDPNNPSCQAIIRDKITGNVSAIEYTFTNEGRALTSGVDLQINFNATFADLGFDLPGGLAVNVLGNYNLENVTQANAEADPIDWAGTRGCALGLECMGYDYRVFSTFTYFNGPWSASLRWQHIPSILAGAAATNPDTDAIGVPSSYDRFSLAASYRVNDRLMVRAGIENPFNALPPLSGGDPNNETFPRAPTRASGSIYDPLPRRFWANVTLNF